MHGKIVDQPSVGVPAKKLVVPGDPDASYLYEKLSKAAPELGDQMPPGAPLEADRLEQIRAWIAAGAKDD